MERIYKLKFNTCQPSFLSFSRFLKQKYIIFIFFFLFKAFLYKVNGYREGIKMMNYIWSGFILIAILIGFCTGQIDSVSESVLTYAGKAVQISISLIGIMALWLGLMKIAESSGLTDFFAKLIRPFIRFLFPDLKKNQKAQAAITMNITANALGLANAATPFGLKAMKEMQKDNPNKNTANNSMCTFLAINTAGLQLIPISVIGILVGLGAKNPAEIIAPCLVVTLLTQIITIITVKWLQKGADK